MKRVRIDIGTEHLIAQAGLYHSSAAAADVARPRLGYMLDKLIILDVTIERYRNPPTVNYFRRFSALCPISYSPIVDDTTRSQCATCVARFYQSPAPSSGYMQSVALSHWERIVILLGIINSWEGEFNISASLCY